jgi:methionine-rich copper-binding protein CopC
MPMTKESSMRPAIVAIAAVAALALSGQASAHARLILGSPKAGSTVAAPKQLRLQYSESIVAKESGLTVAGPSGAAVATGPLSLDPKNKRVVIAPFAAPLKPGAYKVSWRMKTPDGHTTEGSFGFTVKP